MKIPCLFSECPILEADEYLTFGGMFRFVMHRSSGAVEYFDSNSLAFLLRDIDQYFSDGDFFVVYRDNFDGTFSEILNSEEWFGNYYNFYNEVEI